MKPPLYEKKVGRPKKKKTRRKQPQELGDSTKISKHGVIHCKYCGGVDHNKRGCEKRKSDQNDEKLPVSRVRTCPHGGEEQDISQAEYNIIITYKCYCGMVIFNCLFIQTVGNAAFEVESLLRTSFCFWSNYLFSTICPPNCRIFNLLTIANKAPLSCTNF